LKTYLTSALARWVRLVTARPGWTLLASAVVVAVTGVFAVATLRLESDVTELVDTEAGFLRDYETYKADFPQHRRLNVVVIDGADARRARDAEAALLAGMSARGDLFHAVYAPGSDPFLQRHALMFVASEKLERIVDDLARAQPALAILARDPTLRGLADLFAQAADSDGDARALAPLADIVARTADAVARGDGEPPSWAEVMLGDAAPVRRLIVFQGSLSGDDGQVATAQAAVVRDIAEAGALMPDNGVTVRMTGRGPLSSSELASAVSSIQFVGSASLVLVALLLWLGLGSLRAIFAALVTLIAGLVITAAFAALAIGSLNVLSLTFAVLFIGLGIDFAIHLVLRRVGEAAGNEAGAWAGIARSLGPTIFLCGLTTAVAFLAFLPTAFRGLAELGLISAVGMAVAVLMSFTVLPPLLDLLGVRELRPRSGGDEASPAAARWGEMLARHARPVSIAALVLLAAGTVLGLQVRFDFNSLNLQDPDSEAVKTLTDLHADGTITPYTLTITAVNLEEADHIAAVLRTIPQVGEVTSLRDYVPADQDLRLALLDSARIILGPAVMIGRPKAPPDDAERTTAAERLVASSALLGARASEPAFARMASQVTALEGDAASLRKLEGLLADDFVASLAQLRTALSAEAITLESLPAELVARETGEGGVLRVVAQPRDDLRDFEALGAFVDAVHARYPAATGRPALEAGVGQIVVDAFRQAFISAAIAILVVLVITLRSLVDAALVMIPLLLAAALTAAAMVLTGIPLNVANVIVLPLLLGMGVDNGLHVVGRFRETGSLAKVFMSSTPRAVVTSVLTTLFSFVALAFAEHRGMASMGQLLAVAIGFILLASLVVLPALLAWRAGR